LCGDIDERVNAFLTRPIEGDLPYVWIDATYVKVRQAGRIVSVAVILAVGVNTMVLALINTAFAQETAESAHQQWRAVAEQFRAKFPKLAKFLDEAESDVLAFMDFPKAHRKQLASTNPLERVNAEIKRRTDVVGIFPNDPAIVRLVGALMLEQNDEWQLQRRYMQLEGLGVVSDNQIQRLSAVVTG
jgi:putative transposase